MKRLACLGAAVLAAGTATAQKAAAPPGNDWTPAGWESKAQVVGGKREDLLREDDFQKRTLWQMPFLYFMVANSPGVGSENRALWGWLSFFRSCSTTRALFNDLQGEFGDKARGAAAINAVEQDFKAWAAGSPKTIKLFAPLQLGRWDSATQYFAVPDKGPIRPINPGVDADFIDGRVHALTGQIFGSHTGEFTLERIASIANVVSCPTEGGAFKSTLGQIWALYFGTFESAGGGIRIARNSAAKLPELKMTQADAQAFIAKFPTRRIMVEMEVAADPEIYPQQSSIDGDTVEKPKHGRLVRVRYLDPQGGVLVDQSYQ